MAELVGEKTGLDPSTLLEPDVIRPLAERTGGIERTNMTPGELLGVVFERLVEPDLIQPTFVTQFPVELSPLARRSDQDPRLVDRFELYIARNEIANAFSELNDPEDQRARFEGQILARAGGDEEAHAMDDDYVRALEHGLPPTAGEGIGLDRLIMLLAGVTSIREVILFPQLRPETRG
jgi:lysyl-tRNA synthetase class 2